ncbi:hypothetical protein MKX01_039810 [Papaver californicum]|nr:hypothetical protein MKX01_039810 [Papaver californicum]
MYTHQTAVLKNSSDNQSRKIGVNSRNEVMAKDSDGHIGVLEVYIHEAKEIHNICIYQKQDVYAKICLTSNPKITVSTKIINGGGRNPVFDECLKLNVGTIESSLKCEIWMLSRVKNYLEDQLLGFALVPLSEVLVGNGMLAQEFSLSSSDMLHSPAGMVQLSLSYSGASPDVLAIPDPGQSLSANKALQGSEVGDSIPCDYVNIEFPDPQIVNENDQMVSDYFDMQCNTVESHSSESLGNSEIDNHANTYVSFLIVEKPLAFNNLARIEAPNTDTPQSSVSTNSGSPSASVTASSQSNCDTPGASKSSTSELVSPFKKKNTDATETEAETESESSNGAESRSTASAQSVFKVNIEPEQQVVQQDIVDMYMKSMQQFTDSLAKMKLPLEGGNGNGNGATSGNDDSKSDQKIPGAKGPGSRVFYGSRAFF